MKTMGMPVAKDKSNTFVVLKCRSYVIYGDTFIIDVNLLILLFKHLSSTYVIT